VPPVNDKAARRRTKALARQRRAQQRQAVLDEAKEQHCGPQTGDLRHKPDQVAEGPRAELPAPSDLARGDKESNQKQSDADQEQSDLGHWLFDEENVSIREPAPAGSPAVDGRQHDDVLVLANVELEGLSAWLDDHSGAREDDQSEELPTRQRRRGVRGVVTGIAALLVGGALAWQTVFAGPQAQVTLETTASADEVLVVGSGTIDLAGLARQADLLGRPDALQRITDATYLLSVPMTVGSGGRVELTGSELRLLSQPGSFVGLEVRGGALTLRDAAVMSWDSEADAPDTNVTDGRAYILARDGGRMDVVDSSASMLGYDEFERYGISWRTAGTEGLIDGSTFSGNFYGAYMNGVEPMSITDSVIENSVSYGLDPHSGSRDFNIVGNTFRNNGKHGMILAEDCTGVVVRGNESYGNREHGMVVFSGSDDVVVEGNRVHSNGAAGISVNGSARATLRDNDVWANTTGITIQDDATGSTIENNRVSGNREDAILISSERSTASIVANRLDHNGRAGVWVSDGQATIGPDNHIANNESGVRLVDEMPSVGVFDNLLIENYKDGISLVVSAGISISGNRIVDSSAAFSVRTTGLAAPFLEGNTMEENELGPERVREPDTQAAP
jgi:parallel beta-helix repeat protein